MRILKSSPVNSNGTPASTEGWTLEWNSRRGCAGKQCKEVAALLLPFALETSGKEPTWNFWKYLVAPDGKVVGAWDPTVSVEEIRPHITELVRKLILKKREDL